MGCDSNGWSGKFIQKSASICALSIQLKSKSMLLPLSSGSTLELDIGDGSCVLSGLGAARLGASTDNILSRIRCNVFLACSVRE